MGRIKIVFSCPACGGTGIRNYTENHQPIVENPCSKCGGDGLRRMAEGLDDTLIQQIIATQIAHTEELDYIHGKVTAIWNKVKDLS